MKAHEVGALRAAIDYYDEQMRQAPLLGEAVETPADVHLQDLRATAAESASHLALVNTVLSSLPHVSTPAHYREDFKFRLGSSDEVGRVRSTVVWGPRPIRGFSHDGREYGSYPYYVIGDTSKEARYKGDSTATLLLAAAVQCRATDQEEGGARPIITLDTWSEEIDALQAASARYLQTAITPEGVERFFDPSDGSLVTRDGFRTESNTGVYSKRVARKAGDRVLEGRLRVDGSGREATWARHGISSRDMRRYGISRHLLGLAVVFGKRDVFDKALDDVAVPHKPTELENYVAHYS